MSVKVGDRVLLPSFVGTVVKLDNKEFKFIDDDNILAVFTSPSCRQYYGA
jgi:co-chaperonin GroES (HSP10)